MAKRILVQCRSHDIPGEPDERRTTMANIVCEHTWNRPFDKDQDRVQSSGQYRYDQNRVYFLIDNGPLDSRDVSTSVYRWNGKELLAMPLNPVIAGYLQTYPFDGKRNTASKGYSDEEYRLKFGEERFQELILERIRQRRKWGQDLLSSEKEFLEKHPELLTQL
ncbi:hypothetical protein SPI_04986 [Niveomyces insectorum RCEF 264]|uniref:Uncharacterized protein n=1 Tax=Niveomyces insectorum RCEF 264 TaxID=1081102 RepID=A0A167TUL2_9HYPO|nr:hypothetical protein SPI_04986 [Niveomyces insectorum RCEF 264]